MSASELTSEYKASFLGDLKMFLDVSKRQVGDFLSKIGWTEDGILQKEVMAICPLNPGHSMPPKSLQKHVETCKMMSQGYTKEEIAKEAPSSSFAYEKSPAVVPVIIDRSTQTHILTEAFVTGQLQFAPPNYQPDKDVPRSADRAVTDLMTAERLAIYNYVVAKGKESKRIAAIDLEQLNVSFEKKQEPEKPKSHLEILAEQRDYKRRRQSYRAKNVHITKKSYTEIMREVINNQTEMLQEMAKDKIEEEDTSSTDHVEPSRRKRERHSTGSGSSSSPKRHRERSRSSHMSRAPDDETGGSHRRHHHKKHRKHKSHSRKSTKDKHRSRNKD